jgi:hypothetical protein
MGQYHNITSCGPGTAWLEDTSFEHTPISK